MKHIRFNIMKIDWVMQSVMILGVLVGAGMIGFYLLIWQFVSAFIVVIRMHGRHVGGHFIFLALLLGFLVLSGLLVNIDAQVRAVLELTIPWTLILYYWMLTTFSVARRKDHTGKFLPHIGF